MHTHYKGTGKVHSFRGLLTDSADGNQNKIDIEGSVGAIAWRVTKFLTIQVEPGEDNVEHITKIYREEQSTVNNSIDFRDDELLGVAYYTEGASDSYPGFVTVIFDNALFVRNIYVTHADQGGASSVNYYIELEEVTVSAAGKAQLAVAAARRTLN
jgi:hypothetical protein